jgi:carboxyl-terminal processing protease
MISSPQGSAGTPQPNRGNTALWVVGAVIMLIAAGFIGFLVGQASEADTAAVTPVTIAEVAPEEQVVSLPAQVTDVPPTATAEAAPTDTVEPSTATPAPTASPVPTAEAVVDPTAAPVIISDGTSPLEQADLNTFYDVWEVIADQYDGSVPLTADVLDAAIAGSLETLDDEFTRYVPADIAERMRQDMTGAVEGIGAFVQENDEGLFEIVRPIDGQPADLAGLKAGDIIIEVDGESMLGISFDEVILLVRGPEGTLVNLKVQREGEPEPLEFDIVRTRFEVPVVEFEMLPDELTGGAPIGYIRLTEFNLNADERLREGLTELLAQQPQGLILDLRDNPGGFLDQSVAVADAFLPEGVALFERNIRGLDETFRTDDGDLAEEIPLVVLVNAGSASASEIVAGAIQDRGRATLVGETTFGKGSVQQIYTLSDGSELRVTIARWYTPNNSTIDKEGITPDIEVETPEDLGGPEDGQLMRAIQLLLTGQ